jgi:hypothetical protein
MAVKDPTDFKTTVPKFVQPIYRQRGNSGKHTAFAANTVRQFLNVFSKRAGGHRHGSSLAMYTSPRTMDANEPEK